MSYNDLMDAYKRGRISRRSFVRGMVAVGVSAVVAERLAAQVDAAPVGSLSARSSRFVGEDVYDDVYGGETELPATGAGSSAGGGISMKFLAIGGAAAAAGAAVLRRVKGAEAPSE